MSMTPLGACEWFVWDLRRSNLVDRGQLDQICIEFLKQQPGAEPPALAAYLVEQVILTPFQAERLLQGKTQPLVLGPYVLVDALGSGSMGTVYRAKSKVNEQWYAIKVLPRRSMWNVRIARRLVRTFEQIKHPAVVPFVDVGTAAGVHYLTWPLVEGEPLDVVVTHDGQLSAGIVARYGCQAAEALDLCHQAGLIHGLLKPSNLMSGKDGQLHILDFGIGALLTETGGESLVDTMASANALASSLDCVAPECIVEPTKRTCAGDQYSLGCGLYFCLTGRYPFPGGTAVEKMMAHQMKQPTRIQELAPDVPSGIVEVVDRLMAKSPDARFPSMAHAADALRAFAETPPQSRRERKPGLTHARPARLARTAATIKAAVAAPPPASPEAAPTIVPATDAVTAAPAVATDAAAVTVTPPLPSLTAMRHQVIGEGLREKFGPLGVFSGGMLAGVLTWFGWMVMHR